MRRGRTVKSLAARFWAKVEITPTCWLWTGRLDRDGYGEIRDESVEPRKKGKRLRAHRAAYKLLVGPLADELTLDHLCHNADKTCKGGPKCPHRRCVRPDHTEPASSTLNTKRGRVGINQREKTHCPKGHPYNDANTWNSKLRPSRQCRVCGRERARRYRKERRENA